MTPSNVQPHLNANHPKRGEDLASDHLARWITYSIAFHILMFICFSVRAFFSPSEEIKIEPTIRVDIVSLPDRAFAKLPPSITAPPPEEKKLPPPPPQPVAKPVAIQVPKPEPPKLDLNKNKHNQEAALRRLQALQKLQQAPEPEAAPEHKADQKEAETQSAPPVRGNVLSNGNGLKGVTKLDDEQYTQTIQEHITRHWNLPQFLSSANLSALVRVFVDARGTLLKKVLVRSSNNPVFDQSAMQAVDSALPLPRPPDDLVNVVSVRGIDIDFTPEH